MHIFYDPSRCCLSAMLSGNAYFHLHPYAGEAELFALADAALEEN